LAKATLCGRDITTDQFGRYNLRIRKVLEAIYERYEGDRTTVEYKALETYLKRVWFSNGIHHHYGCEKFVPAFTEEYFRQVVDCCGCEDENIDELCKVIFDPTVLPKRPGMAVLPALARLRISRPRCSPFLAESYFFI
jgi:dipeptidyl-peptidase-3